MSGMAYLKNKNSLLLYFYLLFFTVAFLACKKSKKEVEKERGTVVDVQGNVYNTIKIGNQWWMTENLKVKMYNDSTPIVEVNVGGTNDSTWYRTKLGMFCSLDSRYGLHYNWYAITNVKKLAPAGWHIPSDEEWKTLEKELGMSQLEADKTSWRGTKESEKLLVESSVGWPRSLAFGTNESGFSALPGGCRLFNGSVGEVAITGYWWSSSEKNVTTAWYRNIATYYTTVFRYYVDKNYGLTVRCVKD
jgi:uncharacterized protein (TIGR02145 family)